MDDSEVYTLESVIEDCGGFGRFQVLMMLIVLCSKIPLAWSILMMAYTAAIPDWTCVFEDSYNMESLHGNSSNVTDEVLVNSNGLFKQCGSHANMTCVSYSFKDNMKTVVNEVSIAYDAYIICHMS